MDTKQGVLDMLNDLTGEDLSDQMDENIFDIDVPVSEFNRAEWDTPNKIVTKVESLENE